MKKVSSLDFQSGGQGFKPGHCHGVVSLDKKLYSTVYKWVRVIIFSWGGNLAVDLLYHCKRTSELYWEILGFFRVLHISQHIKLNVSVFTHCATLKERIYEKSYIRTAE